MKYKAPFRLSPMQEGLLFHSVSAQGSELYICQVTCPLGPKTDVSALEQAWRRVFEHYGVLRVSFHWQGLEEPLQQEHDDVVLPWDICDKNDVPGEDRATTIERCVTEEMARGFDLTQPPLMRLKLLRFPGNEYFLIWTFHHLLLDGRSRTAVLRQVAQLYDAFRRGQAMELPPSPPFRDYVEWYYRQDFSAAESYWRKVLHDFTSPSALLVAAAGTDALRPGEPCRVRNVTFTPQLSTALAAAAAKHKVTATLMVQAALVVLLGRYSGREDVVFGETRAGRRGDFPGVASVAGLLINTVPIRAAACPEHAFTELLAGLRKEHLELRDHEHLPLQKIVSLSGIPRNAELFNSIVVFEEYDLDSSLRQSGTTLWNGIRRRGGSNYPLTILGFTRPALSLQLHYDPAVICDAAAEGIGRHLSTILEQVAVDPEIRLRAIRLLPEAEHARLVRLGNAAPIAYPGQTCVHRLFEEQAAKTPDNLALKQESQRLTYRELNARANQLARYLRERGVTQEARVGICLERSVEMIVTLLAVLKAGGAYVPFDPRHPAERLATMAADAGVKLIISERSLLAEPPSPDTAVVWFETPALDGYSTSNLTGLGWPENLAYIMYTSGSTGTPKGVAVTHRNIVRLLFGVDYAQFGERETMLHLAPLGFDASTFEIWGALLHGGRLVLYPREAVVLEKLEELVRAENVTSLWLTASLFNLVVDSWPEMLKGVRQLLAGGEALSIPHIDRALERMPGSRLINGYGPTESTTFTCCYQIPRPRPESWTSVPIGTPIANTRVFVLDSAGEPSPMGVAGELFIGGDGLARGYFGDPQLTARSFVPNPFADSPGERLYATGDIVRRHPDGLLEFVGRRDDQVKIRGFRIEPREVEAVLRRQAGVRNGVVIVHTDDRKEKRLVGYVVLEPGTTDVAALQAQLRRILPDYMVPPLLISIASLPLTPNGKLDRAALPVPAIASEAMDRKGAPRNHVEETLAGIWSEVLRVDRVGIIDNFFELGGHSLRAMQVVSRVREALGVEVPLSNVFEHPTIASLAACIDGAMRERDGSQLPPIRPVGRRDTLPLSFPQQRLFFLQQFEPGNFRYNIPLGLRLTGNLNLEALRKALQRIVDRHESLRTRFVMAGGAPAQVVTEGGEVSVSVVSFEHLQGSERQAAIEGFIARQVQQPFDLSRSLLPRAALARTGPAEHFFVLTMHHIVSDAWSQEVFARELASLYDAYANSRPVLLPDLPIQYADFAVWQRENMNGPVLEAQAAYWKEQLAGRMTLELPASRPRPAVFSYRGDRYSTEVSPETLQGLRELGRREGTTLFMTLLAAFNALLHRYTGEQDISLGTPIAGRNQAEVEGLIGFFVNTLVLRTTMSGRMSFRELLKSVKYVALGAYAHQDLPFEKLVEEVQPERTLDRTPLFQVMFAFRHEPLHEWKLPGIGIKAEELQSQTSKFDLTLFLTEAAGRLQAKFEYSTDLFDPDVIERMAGHFMTTLARVAEDPDIPPGELPLLADAERDRVILTWNDTSTDYPKDRTVTELFEQQVKLTPDAPALAWEEQCLTYRELNQQANRIANYLTKAGVVPGSRVAICLERSCPLIASLIAILKTGAAYVPLDPSYPEMRLQYMFKDSRAEILLTDEKLMQRFAGTSCRAICLDREAEAIAAGSVENPDARAFPDSVAYLMYTSGSTGTPKAAAVPHRAITRLVFNTNYVDLKAQDRIAQASNTSFDAATFEIWGALLHGAALIGISQEQLLSASALQKALVAKQISTLFLTPVVFNQVVTDTPDAFRSLRYLLLGGEAVDPKLVLDVIAAGKPGSLLNGYGPTEATTFSAWHEMSGTTKDTQIMPIGKPICNTRLYVFNEELAPAPIGVPGELYIGGPGLAHGYWDRPDLTAERFVPHPLPVEPGERLYRTGDRVRWLADGKLEFLGRLDAQIKLRGFRVELGEIENCLAQHPAIEEKAVLVREVAAGDRRLVAYVVARPATSINPSQIRTFLAERLPGYMVPAAFVQMDALPLTANGKLDRKRLPMPDVTDSGAGDEKGAPGSQTEELLAGIWCVVLNLKHVGVHENFFELGGHSLLSMQVVSRIREVYGVSLTVRDLFECPEIRPLAARIDARMVHRTESEPIRPVARQGELPMSFAQRRLWFLQRFGVGQSAYNIPIALRLSGELDTKALEKAVNEIVNRHEALRTTFNDHPNPVQIVHPHKFAELQIFDVRQLSPEQREMDAKRLIQEEAQGYFDLSRELPVRARLLRMDDRQHVLMLTMHHIASDAWSLQVLMRELTALYDSFKEGKPSPLAPLAVQYVDFAVWQQEALQGPVLTEQMDYWKKQLEGIPELLELPTYQQRPPMQTYEGAQYKFLIPPDFSNSLQSFSRSHGVTLYMTLLTAFQTLLHRYSGQEDIVTGTPIAGRNRAEIESLIGFFVNTLVLRARIDGDASFQELLRQVRDTALAAYAYQDLPFEKLVEELQPERDLSRTPLFQVWFSLRNQAAAELSFSGLELQVEETPMSEVKFDLSFSIEESMQGLRCVVAYRTDLFDGRAIAGMAGHYQRLLEAAIEHPDAPVWELSILTGPEQAQMLDEWNRTATNYGPDQCIHQAFEAQVKRTPGEAALICEETRLTYDELNRKANQVAHYLRGKNVGPEVRVGICMERSREMVITLLGILKAGGAYVPLDHEHPQDRLAYMAQDSGIVLLLTHSSLSVPLAQPEAIDIDRVWNEIGKEPDANPSVPVVPGNLAYVIYTSGSTGVPKGVANEHRGVVNHLCWLQEFYPLTSADRIMQRTPYTFDVSIPEFFWTLMNGAALVVARPDGHKDPDYMVDLIAAEKISAIFLVPSLIEAIFENPRLGTCTSLKRVISTGEALPLSTHERFFLDLRDVELINAYGPTETAVEATHWKCTPGGTAVPIGRPGANTCIYILDPHLKPMPAGVPGEMFIGGAQVARGYVNRPDVTAEKFIPNPFASSPGERMYRTGDLARWNAEGAVEFLGRRDYQVKLRGFRIELGEIESVLMRHPAVLEGVVVLRERADGDKQLAAYVTARDSEAPPETGALKAHLQEKLPEYMIPSTFMLLETLPRTSSGKIDRKLLPVPEVTVSAKSYVAPRNAVEETLAGIWSQLLNVPQIGIHNNFFELGGHSLLAIKVISRVRDAFQVEIQLKSLFADPTIARLAETIERLRSSGEFQVISIKRLPPSTEPPLSYNQEGRLLTEWYTAYCGVRGRPFQMMIGLDWSGAFDAALLEGAINHLIRRHRTLRASFRAIRGETVNELLAALDPVLNTDRKDVMPDLLRVAAEFFRQTIWPEAPFRITVQDVHHLDAEGQNSVIAEIVNREVRTPFDYEKPPLMRLTALKMGPEYHRLIWTIHHLVADFTSADILIRELPICYQTLAKGCEPSLPEQPVEYSDYAAWQRSAMQQGNRAGELAHFWMKQLMGIGLLHFKEIKGFRLNPQEFSSGSVRAPFDAAFRQQMREFAQSRGVTTYTVYLTGLFVVLHLYSGKQKIGIWGNFANRTMTETENVVGWFANFHTLGIEFTPEMQAGALLEAVNTMVLDAHAHQEIPFWALSGAWLLRSMKARGPQDEKSPSPFVMFDYHALVPNINLENGPRIRPVPLPLQSTNMALHFLAWDEGDEMGMSVHYSTQLFPAATIRQLMDDFKGVMEQLVSTPDTPISSFSALLPSEVS